MNDYNKYAIDLDVKFSPLEVIDIPTLIASCTKKWQNKSLCEVNDSVVRLAVIEGAFHWHKHEKEDEFFFVLQGKFLIDLEGETITLEPHQGCAVPRGVVHRTRAPERAVILMVEGSSVEPTGD